MVQQVLHAIDWRYLSFTDLALITVIGGSVSLIMAWLTDIMMERLSLGVVLNALVIILGAVIGLSMLVWAGFPPTRQNVMLALFACWLSGILFLMLIVSFKRTV